MDDRDRDIDGWNNQTISTLHHTLRAPRRRLTVGIIATWTITLDASESNKDTTDHRTANDEDVVRVRRLAREIAAIEQEISVERATGQSYHSVYTTLSQTHLPELDGVRAIEYDADRQLVKPGRNLAAFAATAMVSASIASLLLETADVDCYTSGAAGSKSITD